LYEITYYIQGIFQLPCFDGLTFAAFVDNVVIPQSRQTTTTGIFTAGQGFNISKTFCLFFAHGTTLACSDALQQNNSFQIRTIPNGSFDCTRLIATAMNPRLVVQGVGILGYDLSPAGTLQPGNAFEIKISRISDSCT
jgi:hypothetical protein